MKCFACGREMEKVKTKYKYVESGLDNIILTNMYMYECECGERMPILENIQGLNRYIAKLLVTQVASLNGKECRFIRKQMGLKGKELASLMGVSPVTLSRWENGNENIGMSNDKLLRMLYIQQLEEEKNIVLKDIISKISLIKQVKKEGINIIKISYRSFLKEESTVSNEKLLVSKIKEIKEQDSKIGICEKISKIIKNSKLSNHPLVKIINELPQKPCPIYYKDMYKDILKEEMDKRVTKIVDGLFEFKERAIGLEKHKCPARECLTKVKGIEN